MGRHAAPSEGHQPLRPSQSAALRLAASKMTGANRRAFEAEMTVQYWAGNPLWAATTCGGGRHTVAGGLAERRPGIRGLGAQAAFRGRQRWEEQAPEGAAALERLAEAHAPHDPTCRTPLASTRRPATAALPALSAQGDREEHWPSPSPMAEGLHRLGCRLRQVVQAQPQKQLAATAALVAQREKKDHEATASPRIKRLRIAGQAPVAIGDVSRGGLTRGEPRACDHDLGVHEQYIPGGLGDDDRAPRRITCGSSFQTSAGLVEALEAWGAA